jgi:hypothetical protein
MLIISDLPQHGPPEANALRLVTPLELIFHLEHQLASISSVVLEGSFANNELAAALRELYPELAIARRDGNGATILDMRAQPRTIAQAES